MSNLSSTMLSNPPTRCFECIYIRETPVGFDLVAQYVRIVGGDFTLEEDVLMSAPTPHPLVDAFRTGAVWDLVKAHPF